MLTNSTNSTLLCFIPEVLWFKNTRLKKHIKKEVALERKNGFCWWFFFDSFHCCICNVLGEYQCTAKHCKLDDVGTLRYFRFCNQFFGGQQKSMASFRVLEPSLSFASFFQKAGGNGVLLKPFQL